MTHFEIIGRIVSHLHTMSDEALQDLLVDLEGDLTDENIEIITYGKDDTEHLLSSTINAEDLRQATEELKDYDLLAPEYVT